MEMPLSNFQVALSLAIRFLQEERKQCVSYKEYRFNNKSCLEAGFEEILEASKTQTIRIQ